MLRALAASDSEKPASVNLRRASFHGLVECAVRQIAAAEHAGAVAVAQESLAKAMHVFRGHCRPRKVFRGQAVLANEIRKNCRGHFVEEFLLILEVPVERGGLHVEFGSDFPHGQAVQAGLIQDAEGGANDGFSVEIHGHAGRVTSGLTI